MLQARVNRNGVSNACYTGVAISEAVDKAKDDADAAAKETAAELRAAKVANSELADKVSDLEGRVASLSDELSAARVRRRMARILANTCHTRCLHVHQ